MDIDDRVRAAQGFLDYRANEILKHNLIKQLARNVRDTDLDEDVKRLIEAILGE